MEHYNMNLTLKVWRQKNNSDKGGLVTYQVKEISSEMSFLEMFDVLNEQLVEEGKEPIAFDHDCREGICGMCSMYINGRPHGPWHGTTTCQLHMRAFKDGDTIIVEPWRAKAFPVIKDLVVDRAAFDRIIQAGGYVSVNTGVTVDANATPIGKDVADKAFATAACIGCGACVAACKNSSAMLFVSAKVSQLALLPQGTPERHTRALGMLAQMDKEEFGSCTNTGGCEAVCPKEITLESIARLNREYIVASIASEE
jgi:succinate dehydrogenase / fumarate reductase iron-sulfur subunit